MKKTPPPEQDQPQRLSREERDYFQAVEAHFISLRGKPLLLSPLELQRTAAWHREGIPLRDVCRGIDRYFEERFETPVARERAVTLKYCEHYVRQAHEEGRQLAVGSGDEGAAQPENQGSEVVQALVRLLERLSGAREGRSAEDSLFQILGRAADTVNSLIQKARGGEEPPLDVQRAEGLLEPLDKALTAELLHQAGPDLLEEIHSGCAAEISSIDCSMDQALRSATLDRMTLRRLRERERVPEISLFSL